ncbi:MAG: M23 family metallopeptidase [Nocardioidaceae bacterium]|nr:M23 family metallopeptidase [Nocardioidaceae bacterium]
MRRCRSILSGLALSLVVLALAWSASPVWATAASDGRWVWPLDPSPPVVAGFDPPDEVWGSGHRGVDLLATQGQSVAAMGAGEITYAGNLAGRGVVVVNHGSLRSTYEPVTPSVKVGNFVGPGDVIGTLDLDRSHCLPEPCLHLGVKRGDDYLDPLSFLGPRAVRLKPTSAAPSSAGTSPPVEAADPATRAVATRSVPSREPGHLRTALGAGAAVGSALVLGTAWTRRQARG